MWQLIMCLIAIQLIQMVFLGDIAKHHRELKIFLGKNLRRTNGNR